MIAVFVFAIAAMESVPRHVIADPLFALELLLLIVALTVAWIGLSVLVFWRAGVDRGLVIGLLAGFRNIGAGDGGARQLLAGPGLVLFRPGAVSDLPVSGGAASRLPGGS